MYKWENSRNVEKRSRRWVFSRMSGVFYQSVIQGLGFSICFMIIDFTRREKKHKAHDRQTDAI